MDTCTSGAHRRGDRAIGPYDYISCGETSEKVGCSIGSAWVGPFDERGHGEVWEVQGGVDGHKISFSLGGWFSCDEQKDRQEDIFFNLGYTGREASCCRGDVVCRKAKGPFIEGECLMVQREFQREWVG